MIGFRISCAALCIVVCTLPAQTPSAGLIAQPTQLEFVGHHRQHRLLISERNAAGERIAVAPRDRSWKVHPKGLVRLDEAGVVHALRDGEGRLEIHRGTQRIDIAIKVRDTARPPPVSFRNEVLPILTRQDCNSGGCHGAATGKKGFALSLFGYAPGRDHVALTRELRGRRTDDAHPEQSLWLRKPTGQVPHEGGQRLDPALPDYATLVRWISEGSVDDGRDAQDLVALRFLPERTVFDTAGKVQPLVVLATYADGQTRDVTDHTILSIDDPQTARIEGDRIVAVGPGRATLLARFGAFAEISQAVFVPKDRPPAPPATSPSQTSLDRFIRARLKTMRHAAAPLASDGTFFRRLHLDLTNRLPTAQDTRRFLADPNPNKRARWIDRLTNSKAYAEVLTLAFAEVLRIEEDRLEDKGVQRFTEWLQGHFEKNTAFDRIAHELLTASGPAFQSPATNFWLIERDSKLIAEHAAQVFLGVRIQCAQCHDHPFERWTMDDYYGFTAFFARTSVKRGENPRERIVMTRGNGDVRHPVSGAVAAPRFLGAAEPAKIGRRDDRRRVLADWLTAPGGREGFAEHIANRIFARFFGRGLVEPVDDVRISNPPSHPELYRELGQRLIAHEFDLRAFTAELLRSATYQQATDAAGLPATLFAGAALRRLNAEALLEAIDTVTGIPTRFRGRPVSDRATNLPGAGEGQRFLEVFGRSARESACSCERRSEPTLSQALHLINGTTVEDKIRDPEGRLARGLRTAATDATLMDELWLAAYCRYPREAERRRILAVLAQADDREAAWSDVYWAVLNSREFLFQH